jgi:hypothetical protein
MTVAGNGNWFGNGDQELWDYCFEQDRECLENLNYDLGLLRDATDSHSESGYWCESTAPLSPFTRGHNRWATFWRGDHQ